MSNGMGGGITGGLGIGTLFGLDIAGSIASGLQAQKKSNLATRHAREFALHMANTQYQRGVRDLKKAGLNPMLAYTQGGAAAPNVGAADVPPLEMGDAVGGAQRGVAAAKEIQRFDADVKAAQANASTAKANEEAAWATSGAIKRYAIENAAADVAQKWSASTANQFSAFLSEANKNRVDLETRMRGYDEQEASMRMNWLRTNPGWYDVQQKSQAIQGGASSASQVWNALK